MKLDPSALRYLSRDHMRVLTGVEMGMKNHDTVPVELITQIAGLRHGGVKSVLMELLRHKLIHHENLKFDGYRLTNLGYDYLSLNAFMCRDVISGVGRQIGVGKESDIFTCCNEEGEEFVLKLHRLGRTSFRAIKDKRDYHKGRGHPSWLYLSRLAANKEFLFMKALHENGYPVPKPIDWNRHCVLMSLVDGYPLQQVTSLTRAEYVYDQMMGLIERLAKHGLIHGDLNEFNVLVRDNHELIMIDFPQMVSMSHPNAKMYFERDVNCVRRFFRKRFGVVADTRPQFEDLMAKKELDLDVQVAASGFTPEMDRHLAREHRLKREGKTVPKYDESESEKEEEEEDEEDVGEAASNAKVEVVKSDNRTEDLVSSMADVAVSESHVAPADAPVAPADAPVAPAAALGSSDTIELGAGVSTELTEEEYEAGVRAAVLAFDDDGPKAHLLFDHVQPGATQPEKSTVNRREARPRKQRTQLSVRERVKREKHGKKNQQQGGKTSRNAIKNRDRRKVDQEIREG